MTMLDLTTVVLQIALPVLLVTSVVLFQAKSHTGFIVQVTATGMVLLALVLAAVWMIPSWWGPHACLAFLALVVIWMSRRVGSPANR